MSVLLLAAALFASAGLSQVVVEKLAVLPSGWVKMNDHVNRDEEFSFSIAMQQPKIHALEALLISNTLPKVHLSFEEANLLSAPSDDDVDKVMSWLASYGITNKKAKRDWIYVRTTVGSAELLLSTTLSHYAFEDQAPVLRAIEYHVPDSLKNSIRFVHPIANFMRPKHDVDGLALLGQSTSKRRQAEAPCSQVTGLDCIRDAYNFHYQTSDGKSSVLMGIAGFLDDFVNYQDSDQFLERYAPVIAAAGHNYTTKLVNGGKNLQQLGKSSTQAAVSVDLALALAYPSKLVYYSTGGQSDSIDENGQVVKGSDSTNEPYVELFQHFLDQEGEIPSVLAISYSDDEISVPQPYAEKVCGMIGTLAARGMTVLVESGDAGAMGVHPSSCVARDGSNRKMTLATFPSTCPWVLAVGAVSNTQSPPYAADFSAGGFSTYFERPSWQDNAVKEYVKALDGHLDGYYDASMRAVPDISAIGTNILAMVGGREIIMQGTGASTTIVASMLATVNDARARKGKSPLGWVNKLLYSDKVRATLRDITEGESMSCTWDGKAPGGWLAKEGWDAVTGLGTPKNFDDLLQVLVDAH